LPEESKNPCFHCGEDCGKHPVIFDEKPFCCNGCRTVYEILFDGDACDYYNLDQFPGVKINEAELGNKYAYLDHEEIKQELLDFSDGGVSKVKFFIPSIHCSSCIWLLENLHKLDRGIIYSTVNFVKKEVTITYKDKIITLRRLVEILSSINYVPLITLNDLEEKSKKTAGRHLIYKLGVAAFCFMNIMLFSFPEYLDAKNLLESDFQQYFGWLSLLLSLPVVFYAATDYFVSAYKGIRRKIINIDLPIALGIIALFSRSAYEIISQTGAGYMDSLAGLVFFLLIGKWYQNKTYQALSFERDYKSYFPVAVTAIDDENEEYSKPLKELQIGDRIIVRNQELIPADSILLKGDANIDYSFVSGESTPVSKELKELIYAGGRQLGSSIELIVEKEVSQSYLTELWNQDLHTTESESRLKVLIDKISQYFTIAIISISLAAGIFWLFTDPDIAMNAFTSVLIVACPCALALTVPFAFGNAMRIFGKNGFYLKKTQVVEYLSRTDTIVFDKTGTITQNDTFLINSANIKTTAEEVLMIKSLVKHSTHPMSQAVYKALETDDPLIEVSNFQEIPAQGIKGNISNKKIRLGSEKFITKSIGQDIANSAKVYVEIEDKIKGYFLIKNSYREGLDDVISALSPYNDLHLLSGDNDSELPNLLPLFGDINKIRFQQSPADKLTYVKSLGESNKHVLMIGDGLNDAGALQASEVGITIADDIYHFSPACDAILEANKFSWLTRFIQYTKKVMTIVKISFVISFLYNIIGIYFAVNGYLTPIIAAILMPLSSVSVVAYVTVATTLVARRSGLTTRS